MTRQRHKKTGKPVDFIAFMCYTKHEGCALSRKEFCYDEFRTGYLHCRLSRDDEHDGTSVSIETQRKVLEDY